MARNIPWKTVGWVALLLAIVVLIALFLPRRVNLREWENAGDEYDVTILRDTWGIPHIYGKTDADATFGLAYANAEDDFLTMQESALASRGILATVYGADSAPVDYMVGLFRIWEVIDDNYDSGLSADTKAVLEAYAAGFNRYAAQHPDEVLTPDLFPITAHDLVANSILRSPLFFGLDGKLSELFGDERKRDISPRPDGTMPAFALNQPTHYPSNQLTSLQPAINTQNLPFFSTAYGSNTFAIAPSKTSTGGTYFAVNSHQPWTGPVAWYEAHVVSEEGLDMTGALFPGSPLIIHGHNRDLGWAFTVSSPDLADTYLLDINPNNPNQYRFDGEWLDLEVWEVPIKVKLLGNFSWTVNQEALWSVYGPVVRQDHGTYALRYAGMGRVDVFEQLYRMNKAANFDQWYAAMENGALPTFNVGYGDKEGNIFYVYNGLIPKRAEGYDWELYLPGDTSETLWTETIPFAELPQVLNPPAGFIQNANSTPFQTTTGNGNPIPEYFSETMGIETTMTNRAWRMIELFSGDDEITIAEFFRYKYDMAYSAQSDVPLYRDFLVASEDLLLTDEERDGLRLLETWDLAATPDSQAAGLMLLTMYIWDEDGSPFGASEIAGNRFNENDQDKLLASYRRAIAMLLENYDTIYVPWGEINRLQRGDVDLAIGGGPDLLHAIYGDLNEDGQIVGTAGDASVLLVHWLPDGRVESFAIHQFGTNVQHPDAPHYNDQASLFTQRQLRRVWYDEVDIRANLEREYRP
jgi:penicillin amidase/acyl-homoserine-lactone acylase